ncbi:MAG: hypothetical protein WBN22_10660 [Verrucomicrobiia bacterium]
MKNLSGHIKRGNSDHSYRNKICSFITIAVVCLFLSAFVSPIPVFAAGEIVAWGDNGNGQCNVPSSNSDFTAIASGGDQSLGLKNDGSIVAWGDNTWGECNVPPPNANFIAVAAGNYMSLGLKNDGSIVAWGFNVNGDPRLTVPPPNTGFVAIAAGNGNMLGLKNDGSIVAWGDNGWGECNVPSPNSGFVAIAAGGYHALGLKADGSIVAWGSDLYGQCDVPSPNTGFVAIAAGWDHSLGLKADGSIVAWGNNLDYWGNFAGQCDVPSPNTGFIAIAAGWSHSLGLKTDGSIVAWGYNGYGECNVPSPNTGFTAIAAGGGAHHSLALKENSPHELFNACVSALSISTNQTGNLTCAQFENRDIIRNCASQQGITNLQGLRLVYDLTVDALEVVRGTNNTVVSTPYTFQGGVSLHNTNNTLAERLIWIFPGNNSLAAGTLAATERFVYGPSNSIAFFNLSGALHFAVPASGTNTPTIYQGSLTATSGFCSGKSKDGNCQEGDRPILPKSFPRQ